MRSSIVQRVVEFPRDFGVRRSRSLYTMSRLKAFSRLNTDVLEL